MTVADLRRTMSNAEWEGWVVYHGRNVQMKQVQTWLKSKSRSGA